ncbi:MAG: VWA domain-containing protein [Holophagales bacterium]|nr:VWA domain-containing protein [Holophagales bacterium]MYC08879.1 VWA domain-containing protein [Holophagales bacterium]
MMSPGRRWERPVRLAAASVLALTGLLPAPSAGQPPGNQTFGFLDISEELRSSSVLGPWIRNDAFSEHPVHKVESLDLESEQDLSRLREIAQGVADSFETLMIRTLERDVALLDGRGGTRVLPYNGRRRHLGRGVKGRILEAGETLTIEIVEPYGRQTDTFFREREWLVRWTDLEPRGLPPFQVDTVYERPGPLDLESPVTDPPAAIRILPPERGYGELLSGRVEIQTLIIDPRIVEVEFSLDGERIRRVRKRPFRTRIRLADPPRQQELGVLAYDRNGEYLGRDDFPLNQVDRPFAARIAAIRSVPVGGNAAIRVAASLSLPRGATLERVEFYRSNLLVEAVRHFGREAAAGAARTIQVEALVDGALPDDFIRVVAKLTDGREREDAQLLQGSEFQSEIDIQLVQFQVLVTDRDGNPVSGLSPGDFEIRENGRSRPAVDLHTAYDVPLVLGLAVDSSDSMLPTWSRLKFIARSFLETAVTPGDRAFLVDFDHTVRLVQPLTEDEPLLSDRLDYLIPMGGTALNDGLLFSLLQYRGEPGRRALVVITDGADQHSRSRPEQSSEFAERLGLPIYFIELDNSRAGDPGVAVLRRNRERLQRIAEATGGRLFHLELHGDTRWWGEPIEQVFARIEEDLRRQHVLTYYTDQPPGALVEPEIRVTRRGLKLRSAVPLPGID